MIPLRDKVKALNLRLDLAADFDTGRVTVTGGSQTFNFESQREASEALDLANYVAFQTLVRVGSHLPSTEAAPTGTTEKHPLAPNSVATKVHNQDPVRGFCLDCTATQEMVEDGWPCDRRRVETALAMRGM